MFPGTRTILILVFVLPLEAQMVMAPSIKRPPAKESGVRVTLGQDEPGCKDSALMPRIAGCTIIQCDLKDDEALEFQTAVSKTGEPLHDAVEGQAEILFYLCPGSLGTNGIMKSTVESLGRNSFRTIFNGKDEADFPIVTAWKDRQWIQVSTYSYFEDVVYVQSAIKTQVEPEITVDALVSELQKSGRMTLSSIHFHRDREGFRADSEHPLAAIAAAMTKTPDLKLRLEVHTADDNDEATNKSLTQKWADSLASWLAEHGVDRARLDCQGYGSSKPIAENTSEEGRAKNRRVELVKF